MIRLFVALLLALASACAVPVKVSQDYDRAQAARFGDLHTWAWQEGYPRPTGDPRLDSDLLNARIQSAIESALAEKGFARAAPDVADFKVAYHLALTQKLDARTVYGGLGPYRGWSGGATTVVDQYELGTLLVDFVDPATRTLLWRGVAESRVSESRDPEERQARVRAAVDKLLAQFPPAP